MEDIVWGEAIFCVVSSNKQELIEIPPWKEV